MFEEARLCKTCKLWLRYYNGQYWCRECLEIFDLIETDKNEASGICKMVETKCQDGSSFICWDCGKTLFLTNEEISKMEEYNRVDFESIPRLKEERDKWYSSFQKWKGTRDMEDDVKRQLSCLSEEELNRLVSGITS